MEQHVLEGTWEEVSRHAEELAGRRVRVTILDDATPLPEPRNEAMLEALRKVRERAKGMPYSGSTEETLAIIREGRAGKMFGHDPIE